MMDLMDVSNEIQETLGRSYNVPDDIDEDELMGGKLRIWSCLTMSSIYYFLLIILFPMYIIYQVYVGNIVK